jgi:hypothetical protein
MGYLVNTAIPASLKFNGVEYVNQLRSFQVSDTSSYRNGIVTTTGSIVIGTTSGSSIEDYQRDDLQRGSTVRFEVTYPSGTTALHPRGRLNIISSSYDPEAEEISMEVGCDLVMAKLLDDDSVVLPFEEIPLDETAKTFEGISSSLAAAGKLIWQANDGSIGQAAFFGGDNFGSYQSGQFVSVRGVTALAVQPLAATAAIPDQIELSYQYPTDTKANNQQGRVDTVTSESNYFVKYPATVFERIKGATVDLRTITAGGVITIPAVRGPQLPSTGCGNTPPPPSYTPAVTIPVPGQQITIQIPAPCSHGYETKAVPQYIPAKRTEVRVTTYDGPAAQTSLTESTIHGPAIELSSQYFSDKFAYCGATYANECLPSPCELFGTETVLLGRQQTKYVYGKANEVKKTITTTWRPKLAAAQPDDWRSGTSRGIAQDFNQNLGTRGLRLYRHQIVIRKFFKEDNANIQETTTYTSSVSRGGGIGAALDAYKGVKTTEVRRSVSSVTAEIRPDSVNAATTAVTTDKTIVEMHGKVGGYLNSAGPYVLKEDIPVPLLFDNKSEVSAATSAYGDYLARFVEGDARGLSIGEGLRESWATNWTPNMPFRYYDPKSDKLMALRADACSWGADLSGCVVVMNGIWVADMQGTVSLNSNIVGAAVPDMSSNNPTVPTPPVIVEPGVVDDIVVNKRFNFHVNVHITPQMLCNPSGDDGIRVPPPGPQTLPLEMTLVVFCRGYIVQPGGLVALENDGSVPVTNHYNVVVDDSLVVIDDDVLFPDIVQP